MKFIFNTILTMFLSIITINICYADITAEEKQTMVDVRQQAMQAMWSRLDRLSTLIAEPGDIVTSSDGSTIVIGNQNKTEPLETYALIHAKEAKQDALEISNLLTQVENFWPFHTSVSHVKTTNAERLVWLIPEAFSRYYTDSVIASSNLNEAFINNQPSKIKRSVCMLALSCGRCHSAFRKVRFDSLRKEGRGWTGSYNTCWTYRNEITLNSSAIRK
jgi:cytochrome c556